MRGSTGGGLMTADAASDGGDEWTAAVTRGEPSAVTELAGRMLLLLLSVPSAAACVVVMLEMLDAEHHWNLPRGEHGRCYVCDGGDL